MAKANKLLNLRRGSVVRVKGKEYKIDEVELLGGLTSTKVVGWNLIGRKAFTALLSDVEIVKEA